MKLTKCIDKPDAIFVVWNDKDGAGDDADLSKELNQKPLPSFDSALAKLISVAGRIADFEPEWMVNVGLKVCGVTLTRNKYDCQSAKLHIRTTLKNGVVWSATLPTVRIDPPATGESNIPLGVTQEDADLIQSFIHEALAYADGKRSQQTFLDDADPDEGEEGEKLPLGD